MKFCSFILQIHNGEILSYVILHYRSEKHKDLCLLHHIIVRLWHEFMRANKCWKIVRVESVHWYLRLETYNCWHAHRIVWLCAGREARIKYTEHTFLHLTPHKHQTLDLPGYEDTRRSVHSQQWSVDIREDDTSTSNNCISDMYSCNLKTRDILHSLNTYRMYWQDMMELFDNISRE